MRSYTVDSYNGTRNYSVADLEDKNGFELRRHYGQMCWEKVSDEVTYRLVPVGDDTVMVYGFVNWDDARMPSRPTEFCGFDIYMHEASNNFDEAYAVMARDIDYRSGR